MVREVWVAPEVDVAIYQEDGSGGYNATPVRICRFAQDVSFSEEIEVKQEGQPGAVVKDIETYPNGFDISIGEFYQRKSEQLTPFKDKTKRFRIALLAVNDLYGGTAPYEQDSHIFRDAACTSWKVNFQDNQIVGLTLAFKAERME